MASVITSCHWGRDYWRHWWVALSCGTSGMVTILTFVLWNSVCEVHSGMIVCVWIHNMHPYHSRIHTTWMVSFRQRLWQQPSNATEQGTLSLQWRHNEHDGLWNPQPHDCLLNRLFRSRSKKTSKLRGTGLCEQNSPMTGEFPAQRASNAENASIWWRHHVLPTASVAGTVVYINSHYVLMEVITICVDVTRNACLSLVFG